MVVHGLVRRAARRGRKMAKPNVRVRLSAEGGDVIIKIDARGAQVGAGTEIRTAARQLKQEAVVEAVRVIQEIRRRRP